MKKQFTISIFLYFLVINVWSQQQNKVFTTTPTYQQVIAQYEQLDKSSDIAELKIMGMSDGGFPIHLFIISGKKCFTKTDADKNQLPVVLINNGIHPGEPDGIDASLQLTKDILSHPELYADILQKVVICIIPIYNVDGALNRGCCSRANQNGPDEYGFRGNAKNLDLNRDFMKMDSKNAEAFVKIFQTWQPHFFIDTHVSDGADYQYTMTYVLSEKNKMNSKLENYQDNILFPSIQEFMITKKMEMTPYVETIGETPETGISAFLETSRFSTGYCALFDCMGIITETHMLKPYNDRVWATYWFLLSTINKVATDAKQIIELKNIAQKETSQMKIFETDWKLDTAKYSEINFKGYEASHKPSEVSGLPRLYYDRNKPYTKKIKDFKDYTPLVEIKLPSYYIIQKAWTRAIDNLKLNNVPLTLFNKDTSIEVESMYIEKYETVKSPYESHYLHYNTKIRAEKQNVQFRKGDVMIKMNTPMNRFVSEALEPQAQDSYFNWNYFDGVLQQKEWFSDYVFEDIAAKLLKEKPELKTELEEAKRNDKSLNGIADAQLLWVYKQSPYYEKTHNLLPVFRGIN